MAINQTNQCLIDNIQRELEKLEWNVPKLAKKTGLSASGLYGVIDGSRWPGPDNLERIAKALGTTPGKLLQDKSVVDQKREQTKDELLTTLFKEILEVNDISILKTVLAVLRSEVEDGGPEVVGNLKNSK